MKRTLLEAFGWYGSIAILVAYALVSFAYIVPDSFWYIFLNGTGAAGLATITLVERSWQAAFLNLAWVLIACISGVMLAT